MGTRLMRTCKIADHPVFLNKATPQGWATLQPILISLTELVPTPLKFPFAGLFSRPAVLGMLFYLEKYVHLPVASDYHKPRIIPK